LGCYVATAVTHQACPCYDQLLMPLPKDDNDPAGQLIYAIIYNILVFCIYKQIYTNINVYLDLHKQIQALEGALNI